MSINVDLAELGAEMADRPFCYLLTVGDDARPHAVAVRPELVDGRLGADVGRRTLANASARPAVSLVFPPITVDGYSLIVDGDADAADGRLTVAPTRAVLHRPAPSPAAEPGPADAAACGSDCVELGDPAARPERGRAQPQRARSNPEPTSGRTP